MEQYGIKAENRRTKERVFISSPMTREQAEAWTPKSHHKKSYKYFRVARYRGKYENPE